ncbi:ArsR/SmtB family transcription factor [Kitasatospora azatica]|uniref:ArsR/SmtB family transcription factor n=1 Tax=Kitasatospora azatica TaxID=58347 RepID=UPI00068A9981|nr:transcriptional regulator [Kitasatospora azatica]
MGGERVRYELTAALTGHSWDLTAGDRPPRLLLAAMERGEEYVSQRVADQLDQFWRLVLAPSWPRLRSRLENDITARSTAVTRDGLIPVIDQLSPKLRWRDGGLDLTNTHEITVRSDATIFVPSVFATTVLFCAGEPDGSPDPRRPLLVYPALPEPPAQPEQVDELIGPTRASLLAELSQPRTTGELAERVHLSPATVSYHLQILHRAGLLRRTRRSRSVLYQRLPGRTPASSA